MCLFCVLVFVGEFWWYYQAVVAGTAEMCGHFLGAWRGSVGATGIQSLFSLLRSALIVTSSQMDTLTEVFVCVAGQWVVQYSVFWGPGPESVVHWPQVTRDTYTHMWGVCTSTQGKTQCYQLKTNLTFIFQYYSNHMKKRVWKYRFISLSVKTI